MSSFIQYHNIDREGLSLGSPPFTETQPCIRTSRPTAKNARGQMFLVAGIGRPRRYYLWETFEIEKTEAVHTGVFRASGRGWQSAPPQELMGQEFQVFRAACANFVGFRCIDGLPFSHTLQSPAMENRPPGREGEIIAFLRNLATLTDDRRAGRQIRQALGHYEPVRALSIRQPHAEAIMRRVKQIEYRSAPTKVRGRIFIYASLGRYDTEEEAAAMRQYGITDVSCDDLPRGVLVGTVELYECQGSHWHLRDPERADKLRKPTRHPQPVWFHPF